MTPLNEAHLHLQKAQEFLEAAKLNLHAGLHNPAASDAVLSGINSKDAANAVEWAKKLLNGAVEIVNE